MNLLANVESALHADDDDAVDDAVRDLVRHLDDVATEQLRALCDRLRERRSFDALGLLADAAIATGHGDTFWSDLAQAHIERSRYASATAVIDRALGSSELSRDERLELFGLQGRILKDRYLAHGNPTDLIDAIGAYVRGIHEGGDPLWLGVNAHALLQRARRDGVDVDAPEIGSPQDVLAEATARSADDDWAAATAVEAHLLVGLPVPVDTIVQRLAGASPFVHASMRRQLIDVWGLRDDHPAIVTLSELLLRAGATTTIELPSDHDGYEKLLGNEWPIPIETYRLGLQAAASVGHVLLQGQAPIGTGFVVAGESVHPSLAGRRVLLTNEHVVGAPSQPDRIPPEAIVVRFDAHDMQSIAGFTGVWWSDRTDLDVAVLVSDQLDATDVPCLPPSDTMPPLMPGAHVYVVGHPGGRSLCLSIRGNDLVDHDGVRIHYKAPTEKGSSGSPVFDQAWNLIGIHHYGSNRLARLHGEPGTYAGNEGNSIRAIRERIAHEGLDRS